jgi:hypothetical protein
LFDVMASSDITVQLFASCSSSSGEKFGARLGFSEGGISGITGLLFELEGLLLLAFELGGLLFEFSGLLLLAFELGVLLFGVVG